MKTSYFFKHEDKHLITVYIKGYVIVTSGEIRVHIELKCNEDMLDRAAYIFEKLRMHQTKLRNGVLFYLAISDKKFAILGDAGINHVTSETFWDDIKETMLNFFRDQKFAEGLGQGIRMAGKELKNHFPYQRNDVNELPDEISFGDN